jgi:hypothetical protein
MMSEGFCSDKRWHSLVSKGSIMRRIPYSIALAGVLLVDVCPAAQHDKNHNDAFVAGPVGEARLAQQVRHKLLMLGTIRSSMTSRFV